MSGTFNRLFFDVPGFGRVNAKAGGSIKLAGTKREMEYGDAGPMGPSRTPTHGVLKFTLKNQAGLSLKALGDLEDLDVTVQDDGGTLWLCSGAFTVDTPEMSNGDIPMEMHYIREDEVK